MQPVIALDIMGGDHAPQVPLQSAQQALLQYPDIHLQLLGTPEAWENPLASSLLAHERVSILETDSSIAMQDAPVQAVRQKPGSSLVRGVQQLASKQADALVTAGNTGATVVAATQLLERLPGVQRPAMAILFPGQQGETVLLDVGAQAQCRPEQFVQFARLGQVFARCVLSCEQPRIGLLNIGEESTKGHAGVRQAHQLLSHTPDLNFVGNIEGWDLPANRVDVAVCDGFVGNIVLKLTEGLSEFFMGICPPLSDLPGSERFHYVEHGGSLVLGLKGVVIITHGRATADALTNAIGLARRTLQGQLLKGLQEEFKEEQK